MNTRQAEVTRLWDQADPSGPLAEARHVLLTTYGPDGTPHEHTCRVVADGNAVGVLVRTAGAEAADIRRRPGVLIGACDSHGIPTGPRHPARAELCAPERTVDYRVALINKYGLRAMWTLARARLAEGLDGTIGIRLSPPGTQWPLIGPAWRPTGPAYSLN